MKLLVCTQTMDSQHPILGFFHRWVEEFAKHCEVVHVICLEEGEYDLPPNVHVHTLGKESGRNRFKYCWRFYLLIWKLRHEYDSVFVHMNQVYVVLGGLLWRLLGKRIGLWYMHGTVSSSLKIAEKVTHVIFTGSPESFRLPSKKVVVTGHGIDTNIFIPHAGIKDLGLITVGRITPSKNIGFLIEVLALVRRERPLTLTVVGSAVSPIELAYKKELEAAAALLSVSSSLVWHGKVANAELPALLDRASVFVHSAKNGSLDKALLEAMACGLPVVSSGEGAASLPLPQGQSESPKAMAAAVLAELESSSAALADARHRYVAENHSILSLIPSLLDHLR